MEENKVKYVTVYKAQGKLDGESIKAFLEAQLIPAVLDVNAAGQIFGLTVGDLGEVGVMVPEDQAAKARELLSGMEEGEFENEILVGDPDSLLPGTDEEGNIDPKDLRRRVLFLSRENSVRSLMAEAVINQELSKEWVAYSAGSEPAGFVNPLTIQVLEKNGIQFNGHSKPFDEFEGQDFDMVITLCDNAREACPRWLRDNPSRHLGFAEPNKFDGTDEQKIGVFEEIFEAIRATVIDYLEEL